MFTILQMAKSILAAMPVQVRWARAALESGWKRDGLGGPGTPHQPGDVLAQRMLHFVAALHQFAMGRLLHSAWPDLLQVIQPSNKFYIYLKVLFSILIYLLDKCF